MFNEALTQILRFEGGYSNDIDDPGGATNKGITQSTYDSYRRTLVLDSRSVKEITDYEVAHIYERDYWKAVRSDRFCDTHPVTALCNFDCAVNQGAFIACKLLQQAINICYGSDKVVIDGVVGSKTLSALRDIHDSALVSKYLDLRKLRYIDLFNRNPKLLKWKDSYRHRLNIIAAKAELSWFWNK